MDQKWLTMSFVGRNNVYRRLKAEPWLDILEDINELKVWGSRT
jgi:hypothetical protein